MQQVDQPGLRHHRNEMQQVDQARSCLRFFQMHLKSVQPGVISLVSGSVPNTMGWAGERSGSAGSGYNQLIGEEQVVRRRQTTVTPPMNPSPLHPYTRIEIPTKGRGGRSRMTELSPAAAAGRADGHRPVDQVERIQRVRPRRAAGAPALPPGQGQAAAATQSLQQIWDTLQIVGPDQLGLRLQNLQSMQQIWNTIQIVGPNHLGLRLWKRRSWPPSSPRADSALD